MISYGQTQLTMKKELVRISLLKMMFVDAHTFLDNKQQTPSSTKINYSQSFVLMKLNSMGTKCINGMGLKSSQQL